MYYNTFHDISRFTLWSDGAEEGTRARLVLSFRDGNPRLTAYTGKKGAEGVIPFPCDTLTISTVMDLLIKASDSEPGTKFEIDSLGMVYKDDKPTSEKRVVSKAVVGKTKEGINYIGLTQEAKPKIVFFFKPSEFHVFRDSSGNDLPVTLVSNIMAKAYAEHVKNIVSHVLVNYTIEEYEKSGRPPYEITNGRNGAGKPVKKQQEITTLSNTEDDIPF